MFNRFTTDIQHIQKLDDRPQMKAQDLKAVFDAAGQDTQKAINYLMEQLEALTAAGNIGVQAIEGYSSTTIQGFLEELKKSIDDLVLGQIPVNSISNEMLKSDIKIGSLADLKSEYKENLVACINKIIDDIANTQTKTWNITIDTEWTGETAPYTKTIALEGIKATDIAKMYPVWSDVLETRATEKEEYAKISVINSGENSIELICDEDKPTIALNVRLEVTY